MNLERLLSAHSFNFYVTVRTPSVLSSQAAMSSIVTVSSVLFYIYGNISVLIIRNTKVFVGLLFCNEAQSIISV